MKTKKITGLFILFFTVLTFLFSPVGNFKEANSLSASLSRLEKAQNQDNSASADIVDGGSSFNPNEVIKDLKVDFSDQINKKLIQNIEDYQLKGSVGAIITFSENSLVSSYNALGSVKGTLQDYMNTASAKSFVGKAEKRQNEIARELQAKGLISSVKYNYSTILDGIYVTTTYANLEQICAYNGVGRVIVSNTYNRPDAAVTNAVNVYETGIFNSSDVTYTGKGTIVAVLDTGCDYTHTAFTSHTVINPLYNRNDISEMLPDTLAYKNQDGLQPRQVYYGNKTGGKIAFGYDYADQDPDVMPFASEHGTHVAGIIAGKDSTITGVAIDAQLAIMKVFSDYRDGADDGDILAALEDSVTLHVDAINMSLGTSCGFASEYDDEYKNKIYENIEKAGISLVVAASNDYSSAYGSEEGNTNKVANPDSATVGAPSTYSAALSVASINGNKDKYMLANNEKEVYFNESFNMAAKEYNFFEMLGVTSGENSVYEYVTIPGYGRPINYSGVDMTGKIALVRRGDISFEEKVQYAYEANAIALLVYNNVYGDIIMTVGNNVKIPVVSISKDDGEYLAERETGVLSFNLDNQAGPFMSDFSSWGPNPDLGIKPEITAHGGNILSAVPGGGYDKLSGTSMASPNMCGIVILIRQYVKEKFPDWSAAQVRDHVNQLTMSTATIALDRNGNPYSPRKQGAGIADITKATTTEAYLYVDGTDKTKLELGDDPMRTGVYTMSVNLKNLSNKSLSYTLGNYVMTESLSADKKYVAEKAYMLGGKAEYSVENGKISKGVVTVAAGETAVVTAKITLTKEDKSYLNASFKNGMYVEGFLTFDNRDKNGVDLNAPFLAFYGDWSDAPIFDENYYNVETESHNDAIDDDDKIKADYYATTPLGKYYYDYIIPMGSFIYSIDETKYDYIPATEDKAALSYYKDSMSGIYGVFTGLLRGAREMNVDIIDTATGKVVWHKDMYNCYKAHYNGRQMPYVADFDLEMADTKTGELFGDNNAHYQVVMKASLDWNKGERNINDTYTFSFYIDYQPPVVRDVQYRKEYDRTRKEDRYYADVTVYDNHYTMAVRPIIIYDYVTDTGTTRKTYSSLSEDAIPVYQTERNGEAKVTIEITDYIEQIRSSALPEGLTLYLDDYAMNSNICYVPFPETDNNNLAFKSATLDLDINDTFDLTTYFRNGSEGEETDYFYLKTLTWTTSNSSVVKVDGGKIEAVNQGSATISCRNTTTGRTLNLVVNVSDVVAENPESKDKATLSKLYFNSYDTVFAFNNDIDFSDIGETGAKRYFDGNYSLSFYPAEKVKLNYSMEPWNIDPSRIEYVWTSSNPRVASVDDEGVVTGEAEGTCRITLQVRIDGRASIITARCSIEIKSEFIIENRELVAYKGKGGNVVIPDDEGILYIGSFAFCHYNLDNTIEIENDYDFDLKKEPIGNNTVTSVTIPDGVEEIRKYAFYNCKLLKKVTLGKDVKTIYEYAFYNNNVLESVNFDNVKVISNYAFSGCERLNCDEIGGVNAANLTVVGDYAFENCKLLTAINLDNLRRSGTGAFKGCVRLATVRLGTTSQLAESVFENTMISSIVIYSDTIPDNAFKGCTRLKEVEVVNDITYLGREAFSGCTSLDTFTFDKVCEIIGEDAFFRCTSLRTFTLPDSDVAINDFAFENSGLTRLNFKKNTRITSAGVAILKGTSLQRFITTDSDYYTEENGVLFNKDKTVLVLASPARNYGEYTLPDEVVEIGDSAFGANGYITKFTAGSGLVKIGNGAFSGCSALKTVTLGAKTTEIGDYAFFNATALNDINLENVKVIGDYAFCASGITSAELGSDVAIGEFAFYNCQSLVAIRLGANANIGEYAFRESNIRSVYMPEAGGVVINNAAFFRCRQLTTIDLSKAVGKIGDYAFYLCTRLTDADMTNITEIGVGAFADCPALVNVTLTKVRSIGENAFSMMSLTDHGALIKEVVAPELEYIGVDAFYGCTALTLVDIPNIEIIERQAFAFCGMLREVNLGDKLTELKDSTFFGCRALRVINLENIETFGSMVIYGSKVETLNIPSAKTVGVQAFIETDEYGNSIKKVIAPNLEVIGDQAFGGLQIAEISLPKAKSLGFGVFVGSGITEFEVTDNLEEVSYGVFNGATEFREFYTTVDGVKKTTADLKHVKLDGGVLYTIADNGKYVLSSYPMVKADKTYSVIEGTVRIEYAAAFANEYLTEVTFPETLERIGDRAFEGCTALTKVIFKSYYAPELEGTLADVEIKPDNVANYPKFDMIYKYDYYFKEAGVVATPFYYRTFKGMLTSSAASGLKYVYPENSEGYDNLLYLTYFDNELDKDNNRVTSGVVKGSYALAFIKAMESVSENADRFNSVAIVNARTAYNALIRNTEELQTVSEELINKFLKAETDCKVDMCRYEISNIYDVDRSKYSYDRIREVHNIFEELTSEQKSLVENADVLRAKEAELEKAMGKTLDYTLEFEDYGAVKRSGCGALNITLLGALALTSLFAAVTIKRKGK